MAPIYGVEQEDASIQKHGNSASGIPIGTQHYTGPLLSGDGYTAQLFGGPADASIDELTALFPVTTFRTGSEAGFIVAPPMAVSVPGVPEGQPAQIVLRVWGNTRGITNWQQVLAATNVARGESAALISPPLGGIFVAPPNLMGLQSFNLALPPQPLPPIQIVTAAYTPAGQFTFSITAATNRSCTIEASSDFTNWIVLSSNLLIPSSPWLFRDSNATEPRRFYRVR